MRKRLLLAGGSLVVALVAAELTLRVIGVRPMRHVLAAEEPIFREVSFPRQIELVPGWSGEAWNAEVHIDATGYRGPADGAVPVDAPIVVLGDSVAFGVNVEWDDTIGVQLERRLGAGCRVRTIAVPSYDILQEVETLRLELERVHPELVVLQISLNDLDSSSPFVRLTAELRSRWRWAARCSRLAELFLRWRGAALLAEHDARVNAADVFRATYADYIVPLPPDDPSRAAMAEVTGPCPVGSRPACHYADPDRVGRLRHALAELAELARVHQFRVLAVLVPMLADGDVYPHAAVHAVLAGELRRQGFGVVDMTESFLGIGMTRLRSTADDLMHPNARGHGDMARAVADHVCSSPWELGEHPCPCD